MEPEYDIADIGAELVEASRNMDRSPSEVLEELFPYVHDASKRMSTRGIRDWLKENHGIQISQPTISRALRNPEKYWRVFAEYIEPWARRVEESISAKMQDFLFDERIFDHLIKEIPPAAAFAADSDESVEAAQVEAAANFLEQKWFTLSHETRLQLRRYFREMDDAETTVEDEQGK
jgi:hypothetical protein